MSAAAFTNLIVTYNSLPDVSGLLTDLRLHAPGYRSIVIDNASPDGTAAIGREFPEVHLIANPVNVGYARAVNQGFALCDSDYVFLLNPDIRISSSEVFLALQGCLADSSGVAAAAPLQFKLGAHGPQLNFTWSYWTPAAFGLYLSHLFGRPRTLPGPISVRFLNAGCLFLRRSAFDKVGGLNEKYFLYGEEPDLFLKFWRHGFDCRLLPSISVIHNRERSLGTVPLPARLRFRLLGVLNIGDAVLRGLSSILLDRLLGRRPA
jgi:hypothetical protein